MTTRIHRFDFNSLRDFRGPIVVNTTSEIEQQEAYVPPPPPVYSQQDIDSARLAGKSEGYNEGFNAGLLEAKKQSDAMAEQANQIIHGLADALIAAQRDYQHILTQEAAHVHTLTLSVARKVAAEALDARGEAIIAAIIERTIPVIFSKPRLIIDLHPDMFERTVDRIESQMRAHGFEGEVQFRGNEALGMSDISLNWGSGEMQRSTQVLWQEIEALIERIPLELTFAETLDTHHNTTGA